MENTLPVTFATLPAGLNPLSLFDQNFTYLQERVNAVGASNGGLVFTTLASLNSALAYPQNSAAWVVADTTAEANGIYRKLGNINTGSWERVADLPYGIIEMVDVGAGTADEIVAASYFPPSPAPFVSVFVLAPYRENDAAVSLSLNGGSFKPLVSVAGTELSPGALQPGMAVLLVDDGENWRLLTDYNSAANEELAREWAAAAAVDAERAERAKDIAEGYASDVVSQGNVPIYGTVEGLSGLTIPDGIIAFRTNGYAASADGGAWPLAREVPNTGDLMPWQRVSNGGTRRWQLFADSVTLEMLGGKADAVYGSSSLTSGTDNYGPYVNAEAYLAATNPQASSDPNLGGRVSFKRGSYYFSQSLNIKHRMELMGENGGTGSRASKFQTVLVFPQDTTGIYINRGNTSLDGTISPATTSAGSTYLEGFTILSLGGTDRTKHAIRFRALCVAGRVNISSFPGDGWNIVATSGSSDPSREGNANYWRIFDSRVDGCQNGINVEGGDSNAGVAIGLNTDNCRAFGIRDNSFLGCEWHGCGAQTNGSLSRCYYNGNRYWAGPALTAGVYDPTLYNSTEPGTDDNVWIFWQAGGAGGTLREWTPGNTLEWAQGGPAGLLNTNSKSAAFGGYLGESNQPPFYINPSSGAASFSGVRSAGFLGSGLVINGGLITTTGNVSAKSLTLSDSVTSVDPIITATNRTPLGATGSGRGTKVLLNHAFKPDGVTPRPTASFYGRSPSSSATSPTVAGIEAYDPVSDALVRVLELNLATKAAEPVAEDNTWSFGTFSKRWLKGWFGNVSLFPAASVTPANNGEVTFQLSSDTSLTFKVKGSDGTVRSGSITLS